MAILEFSHKSSPKVGMVLKRINGPDCWRIRGSSLPIWRSTLKVQLENPYNSEAIWDCLLEPIGHNNPIADGETFEVQFNTLIKE